MAIDANNYDPRQQLQADVTNCFPLVAGAFCTYHKTAAARQKQITSLEERGFTLFNQEA